MTARVGCFMSAAFQIIGPEAEVRAAMRAIGAEARLAAVLSAADIGFR